MPTIAPATNVAARPHRVMLEGPGVAVPDGDGGYTHVFAPLTPPTLWVSIKPATARDLERVAAGTVLSTATHIIRCPYHSGVTTETRVLFNGRTFNVTGKANIEERSIEMELVAVEVVA